MNRPPSSLYGDSRADKSDSVWSQHQTLITLLHDFLVYESVGAVSNIDLSRHLNWLDVCSGRGQVVAHCRNSIPSSLLRSRIKLLAFDGKQDYLDQTKSEAESGGLGECETIQGDISDIDNLITQKQFHLVTCTNSFHEFSPWLIPAIFVTMINSLEDSGILYVYDMASLGEKNELGATPWNADEVSSFVKLLHSACGDGPPPSAQPWQHKSVAGWSVLIRKASFRKRIDLKKVESQFDDFVSDLLTKKMESCKAFLEALTKSGASTDDEQRSAAEYLHLFWALERAVAEKRK